MIRILLAANDLTCTKQSLIPDLFAGLRVADSTGKECVVTFITAGDFTQLLVNIIVLLLSVAGLVAVGLLIYAGVQYITSAGEPAKTTKAKDTIVNTVIGLVLILLAFAAVKFVSGRF